jgi:hypothetical protein
MALSGGNLSFVPAGEDLQHLLADYGSVRKCSLPLDRDTGGKRGFLFIELANTNDETKATPTSGHGLDGLEDQGQQDRTPSHRGGGRRTLATSALQPPTCRA